MGVKPLQGARALEVARKPAEEHDFGFQDAPIVASALLAACTVLHSEDLQDGR